ncbi:MAG: hypothetical protein ACMXYA_02105, partial [Candidatus Woesearchaeota archaeon]
MNKIFQQKIHMKFHQIIYGLVLLVFLAACTQTAEVIDEVPVIDESMEEDFTTENGYEETQVSDTETIIRFTDDESSSNIIRNEQDMTASFEMISFVDPQELEGEMAGMLNFTMTLSCGMMAAAFFNEGEITDQAMFTTEWEGMEATFETDSEVVIHEIEDNPLEGYEIIS